MCLAARDRHDHTRVSSLYPIPIPATRIGSASARRLGRIARHAPLISVLAAIDRSTEGVHSAKST
ncbi:hypothetical protein CKO51_10880 [Rhodopirellula sp. SM50]|nr:hypothetical protein CKO51_10880 [Rhodopirellula sp. SM50]